MKHRIINSILIAIAVVFAVSPAFVIAKDGDFIRTIKEGEFIPHKNAPGPARLEVYRADNSGEVHNDPQYIADRQAIVNHVLAYSFLIDEGRWEDWYNLFSDDILFEVTGPEIGTLSLKGQKNFRELVLERYVKPSETGSAVRRHTMGNIHVTEQTENTAKVRTYMLISKVPKSDKLKTLTTGTYNVELEKRDGKWVITRWYIECDAPLAPSKFPKGPGSVYIPDPQLVIPGATDKPIEGEISLKNHPYAIPANGPLFKNEKQPWTWNDADFVIVDYLTTAEEAAKFLPEGVTTYPIPDLDGFSAVKHIWANYRDSSFGPYHELIITIPCLIDGEMMLYVPYIYVTTDAAMAGGREIGGWPKKIADIQMERAGNAYRLTFKRGDMELSTTATVGNKIFSTPLPADEPVALSYPQNMTLPLPPPTGEPQKAVPLPTLSLKWIPGVGSADPDPVVAQLIGSTWMLSGDFYGTEAVSISMHASEEDTFAQLPVLGILGATYAHGDMTLDIREMKVLADWLK